MTTTTLIALLQAANITSITIHEVALLAAALQATRQDAEMDRLLFGSEVTHAV